MATLTTSGYSCENQFLIFSNFTYSAPLGDPVAANVNATLDSLTGAIHTAGFSFQTTAGGWLLGFDISYEVSVAPDAPAGYFIIQSKDQMNPVPPTGNPAVVTDVQVGVGTFVMNNISETVISSPYDLTTITSTTSTLTGLTSGYVLQSYEQDFFAETVPEPVSCLLIGSGLMALALFRRRVRKS